MNNSPLLGAALMRPGTQDPTLLNRIRFGQALMLRGADTSPVQSPWEAVGRIGTAGLGGYFTGKAEKEATARDANYQTALSEVLMGGAGSPVSQRLRGSSNKDVNQLASAFALDEATKSPVTHKLRPGETQYDANGKPLISNPATPHAPSELGKLTAERDALPEGHPNRAVYDARIRALGRENQGDTSPIFQDMPIAGDKIQRVVSYDKGRSFQPFGEPHDRREPNMIQDVTNSDGSVTRYMIPRAEFGRGGSPAQSQAAPDPSGFVMQPQAGGPQTAQAGPAIGAPPTPNAQAISTTPGKMSEDQGKAAGFHGRAFEAHGIVNDLENKLSPTVTAAGRNAAVRPFVGKDQQRMLQAQRSFINAILRRESGAVISPEEFVNYGNEFFPQPNEGPEVIAQKRAARENALKALVLSAGPSFKPPPAPAAAGIPPPPAGFTIVVPQ